MKFFRENNFGRKLEIKVVPGNDKKEESRAAFSHPLNETDLLERSEGLIGELNPEMDRIADSYNLDGNVEKIGLLDENQEVSRNTTVKTRDNKILEKPYPRVRITEKNRDGIMEDIKKHPDLYMGLPVRERMGKIYTDQEFQDKSKKILAKRLP